MKKTTAILIFVIIASFFSLNLLHSQVYRNESYIIELKSSGNGDTFITNKHSDKNFGGSKYIISGLKEKNLYWGLFFFSIPDFNEKVYVKSARLVLYPVIIEDPQVYNIYYIIERFFPENRFHGNNLERIGVTWGSMPPFDDIPVNSVLIDKTDIPLNIDITGAIQKAVDKGSEYCGILIKNSKDFSISYDSFVMFYSSNNLHYSYNELIPRVEMTILREKD